MPIWLIYELKNILSQMDRQTDKHLPFLSCFQFWKYWSSGGRGRSDSLQDKNWNKWLNFLMTASLINIICHIGTWWHCWYGWCTLHVLPHISLSTLWLFHSNIIQTLLLFYKISPGENQSLEFRGNIYWKYGLNIFFPKFFYLLPIIFSCKSSSRNSNVCPLICNN